MISRFVTATAAGIAVTLSLLYLMNLLVQLRVVEPEATERTPLWLAKVRVVEPPPPSETPPPEFRELTRRIDPVSTVPSQVPIDERVTLPRIPPATPRWSTGGALPEPATGDGPLISVMMVQPVYPVTAVERELDGFVVVEFDVRADGSVENASVVESSHEVFEKPALAAAERCRFKPRTVAGAPQPSFGVRKRFVFEMDRG